MGAVAVDVPAALELPEHTTFTLRFSRTKSLTKLPEVIHFKETFLQSAIRRHLMSEKNLRALLNQLGLIEIQASALEVLGEKGLPEGHIDLLLKERVPLGSGLRIPVEVKTKKAQPMALDQLRGYMDELRGECPIGILIASDFNKHTTGRSSHANIKLVRYTLNSDLTKTPTFEEIHEGLTLEVVA